VMCFGRHQHYQEFFIASNPIFASKQECCPYVQYGSKASTACLSS
jgi:hypothetical protein